jgi:hypothetical protein
MRGTSRNVSLHVIEGPTMVDALPTTGALLAPRAIRAGQPLARCGYW